MQFKHGSSRMTGKPEVIPRRGLRTMPPANRCDMSNGSCGIGFPLRVQSNCVSVASACIGSPNAHAVSRGEVELVSRLHIECRVPRVEVAHGVYAELPWGVVVGHHLLPE